MKQIKTRKFLSFSLTLLVGWTIGSTWSGPVVAADSATGEIIKVCIDTKTGVIKAATKCSKTERATILGGVGPKGDKGDVGAQGLQGINGINGQPGLQGIKGDIGPKGQIPQLNMRTIFYYSVGGNCEVNYGKYQYVEDISFSWISGLTKSVYYGSLNGCYTTVYVP